jgi:hypothetical protein
MSENDVARDAAMGKAIMRGILFGLPIALVGLTVAIWLITDQDLAVSAVTAILPGVLLGVFGGGFVGMAITMRE